MKNAIKKKATRFIRENHITNVNYMTLVEALKKYGYTVVEFSNVLNDEDVETIIQNLGLEGKTAHSRGFMYADNNYRLVFINEDLNEDEKLYVISHEIGHIVCGHFMSGTVIGRDVREEHEANEFSHYLLKRNPAQAARDAVSKHRTTVIICVVAILAVAVFVVAGLRAYKKKSYYGDFYITATGDRYHQAECIHVKDNESVRRLTKKQFDAGEYEPCGTCLPQG